MLIQCEFKKMLIINFSLFKAFIPYAAHSLQNVIKDGLNFSTDYLKLIKKVSKKIVSKSKFSHLIAEELREFKVHTDSMTL